MSFYVVKLNTKTMVNKLPFLYADLRTLSLLTHLVVALFINIACK